MLEHRIIMMSTLVISIAIIVGVAIAGFDTGQPTTIAGDEKKQGGLISDLAMPSMPLLLKDDKPIYSIDEASKIAGYTVPYPAYLPDGYKVQMILVYEGGDVKMYAWDREIDEETKYGEFYYTGKGILIYIDDTSDRYSTPADEDEARVTGGPISMEQQMGEWLQEFKRYGAHRLTIDGYPCVAYDSQIVEDAVGRKVSVMAEMNCQGDELLIRVKAYLPERELIKVVESIL